MVPKNQLIKSNQLGFSQFILLLFISLLAISLPLTTKLVNQSQDSRSSATDDSLVTDFNFKIAFKGVKPEYSCLSSINSLNVDIVNTTTNTYDSVELTSLEPITNEVNNDGDQVFKVTIPINYNKFNKLNTSNYLRIRSNSSLAKRYCINNQDVSIDSVTNCNINIHDSINIYDFSNYSSTPGDLNQDGVINSSDYSTLKNNLNLDTDITCNQTGDLNQDGIVNSLDSSLIKNVLTQTSEELVLNTPIPTKSSDSITTTQPTNTPTKIPTLTQTPTKTPTTVPTSTVISGTPYSSNSTVCKNKNGVCTTYSKALLTGSSCQVNGYSEVGKVVTELCPGDSKVVCCVGVSLGVTPTSSTTPTPIKTVTATPTTIVGSDKVLLKFAVMADIHDNTSGLKKMLKTVAADGIDITVIAGDLTTDGTTSQLKAVKTVLDNSEVRYVATEGNHDMRKKLFDDVFGKSFQSIKINGVKLILIDNSDYRGLEGGVLEGSGQKAWIESEVTECNSIICIAIMHMPLNHPTSDHVMGEFKTTTASEATWLRKLLVSNGVKEVETGHIHHFNTYTINGLKTNQVGPGTSSDFSEFTVYSDGSVDRKKVYN